MGRAFKGIMFLIITGLLCSTIGCEKPKKNDQVTLNISAAASLKDSINEVRQLYENEKPNVKLNFNYGSSGMLQQQIEQGADVDIFISAADKQMDALESKNLIVNNTRKNILQSDVVLVVPMDNIAITSFKDLTTEKAKKVALGEPKSVPAGQYAEEVFSKLGITEEVKPKVVYAKDVKEVLNWVETGNADAGIVYTTDAKISKKVKIVATAPEDSHTPVIYPAAIIKTSNKADTSEEFMKFLTGNEAKAIFEKYSFKVNVK